MSYSVATRTYYSGTAPYSIFRAYYDTCSTIIIDLGGLVIQRILHMGGLALAEHEAAELQHLLNLNFPGAHNILHIAHYTYYIHVAITHYTLHITCTRYSGITYNHYH